jgi:hypothetical protein
MTTPGGLDHLYRFHANSGDTDGPIWSVSGSSLEGTTRYYRVFYDGRAVETALKPQGGSSGSGTAAWQQDAEAFLLEVQGWLQSIEADSTFLSAVYTLFHTDPWLQTQLHVVVKVEPVD